MRGAWCGIGVAAVLWACGGKAVIDGEPPGSGAGGTSSSQMPSAGGFGNGPTVGPGGNGAGGSGGDFVCADAGSHIVVTVDGVEQTYGAAGPDPNQTLPTAQLVFDSFGVPMLRVKGCLSNASTNDCITLSGMLPSTGEARMEYTGPNGIVFVGDQGLMNVDDVPPVGQLVSGFYDGLVLASGGADSRFLDGSFGACRLPDLGAP